MAIELCKVGFLIHEKVSIMLFITFGNLYRTVHEDFHPGETMGSTYIGGAGYIPSFYGPLSLQVHYALAVVTG